MIIYVDLDHTLCVPDESFGTHRNKYVFAMPKLDMIDEVNGLFDDGHQIVIYTARRMKTHSDDIHKVVSDVGKLTVDWLKKHGIKYHELRFGKPYYDLLIDDKTCLPDIAQIRKTILESQTSTI